MHANDCAVGHPPRCALRRPLTSNDRPSYEVGNIQAFNVPAGKEGDVNFMLAVQGAYEHFKKFRTEVIEAGLFVESALNNVLLDFLAPPSVRDGRDRLRSLVLDAGLLVLPEVASSATVLLSAMNQVCILTKVVEALVGNLTTSSLCVIDSLTVKSTSTAPIFLSGWSTWKVQRSAFN